MKENAQRILSWLYPPVKTSRWIPVAELSLVAPSLTTGGLQSTLAYLQTKKKIIIERVAGERSASITTHGMKALEEHLPVFSLHQRQWKGNWRGVFFLKAPKSDKNFRFLRRILTYTYALPIARGMYLYPGELPEKVIFELRNSYVGSVLVVEFNHWVFGDEREIIGSVLRLGDLQDTYSSISREIDSLLRLDSSLISFSDQQKMQFSSIFDRLYGSLQNDFGIQKAYFPQLENGVDLLFNLQNLSFKG